ncbi:hypothetical protein ACIQ1J_34075 [Streptomyces sp. NPDC097107]
MSGQPSAISAGFAEFRVRNIGTALPTLKRELEQVRTPWQTSFSGRSP